jgi:hypothetical protein
MNMRDVQHLMAKAGYYDGGLDGQIGPKHRRGVSKLISKHSKLVQGEWSGWPIERQSIAVAQIILQFAGFEPGAIDGLVGHNTQEAFNGWLFKQTTGRRERVERVASGRQAMPAQARFPHQRNVGRFYGSPGPDIERQLVAIQCPVPLRLDFALDKPVNRIRLHRKCADSGLRILQDVASHYGPDKMRSLGLDRFAGSHVHRRMRGGRKWSMHAYGCAWDWYAAPNGLRTRCPQALFCGPEYRAFIEIHESHGWTSALRAWGADAMHFQAAGFG